MKYTVADTETLRMACIRNDWFEEGTVSQYNKMFFANAHGCPIKEIATIIWLCSDEETWCRREILDALTELQADYLAKEGE